MQNSPVICFDMRRIGKNRSVTIMMNFDLMFEEYWGMVEGEEVSIDVFCSPPGSKFFV